jgi:hypothetical protein
MSETGWTDDRGTLAREREREIKQQTFPPELMKSDLQWTSSHCAVKLYSP